ncbi:LysR family transcriptional regulator [Mycobacterium intracellulare]|uniref:Probable hydrogen peroxide-inducible genes activator n=1 Tax=Mycobacterium intracellulare TaxID=1767 RepID=A0AAE4UFS9_MYCIT|nr:LysR family transcriptional regulator [Mycobacterium intracellulare]MDV6980024.1 LysR family transcriptional regulator [Mycobacterium intracellulare]MDV6985581.1 LysR family transcriptional regulator [Mycobacterium intracellulare]MDV7015809.1 LysR family transcriptional regulator [Mycobacterium intracellulare]MDV7030643.1 LysR family transcriptional regulator [Mycobacterium intracellulare]
MELRQLRYFVAVAEARHFGRAARRLRIAAPSLSQQIQALERDLHVTLFDRSPRSVVLTPAGEVLLEHAHVLLARAERARNEVRCADGRHRHLNLRIAPGVEHVLDGPLRHLSGPVSGLEVSIATSTDSDAVLAVREEHIDAAIVWIRSSQDHDLAGTILRQVPIYLALPAGHRLAVREAVPVADLAAETIVMFPRDLFLGIWDHIIGHLLPAGLSRPGQLLTQPDLINAPEAVLRSVAAGHGAAPVAPAMTEHVPVPGIVIRPLAPPLLAPVELIWREPAHPALQNVVALLADTAE